MGHILQTTQVNNSQKQTSLFMEGESKALYAVQEELVSHLQSIFPGIEQPKWKEYYDSGFIQVVTAIQNGRQVAYEIHSSIESIKEKFVHITYKRTTVYLNIGACVMWTQLKQVIQECEDLKIEKPIKRIYSVLDSDKSYIQDCFGFKAEGRYYVETEDDLVQKFRVMEEFFVKLESTLKNPIKKDRQMKEVRDAFDGQDIEYDQLMAIGDLALTDEKLKEIGISQLGLRTAILSVIKSNQ